VAEDRGRMREDGLVTAERNSSNKRFVNITLTDKGREALSRAMPVAREVMNQVCSQLVKVMLFTWKGP